MSRAAHRVPPDDSPRTLTDLLRPLAGVERMLLALRGAAEGGAGRGRLGPFAEATSDDFRWIVTGTTPWSKTYEWKQAVFTELFPALRSKMADRMRTIPDRLIAEGDHVVVEAHGENTTRSGKPYNQRYCFVIRVVDGKLRELTEYMDSALAMAVRSDGA